MKRTVMLLAVLSAVLASAGLALASGHRAKVELRRTKVGKILANSRGFTLYEFAKDTRNKDKCVSIPSCTTYWPPDTTSGAPMAGNGVKRSLLGTITLANGRRQVTYAGHPLYTYKFDTGPGATSYIGVSQFGGGWFALSAAGHRVK